MAWRNYPKRSGKTNKYGANKVSVNGIQFDSKKEAKRYQELLLLLKSSYIKDLRLQEKFVLIPAQREPDKVGKRGGVTKGKLIERECSYIADFVYIDNCTGEQVVEDTKGMRTKEYIIKRKLMLYVYGIRIKEV